MLTLLCCIATSFLTALAIRKQRTTSSWPTEQEYDAVPWPLWKAV